MGCDVKREEVAAFLAGDLEPARATWLATHVAGCADCQRSVRGQKEADRLLRALPRHEPSARSVWETRRVLATETGQSTAPEIMTLDEVAAYLRVPPETLADIAAELPAFEVGGRIRVRRARLEEWIAGREAAHRRRNVESELVLGFRGIAERGGVSWRRR